MKFPAIILASASPRRAQLLRQSGIQFKILTSATRESHAKHLTPREICLGNAYRKALAVSKRYPDALILGADTVVALGSKVYGKPRDLEEAHRVLTKLQGGSHEVMTGVCLMHLQAHRQRLFAVSTTVTFRRLQSHQIHSYLSKINPLDKAGGYAIQEAGNEIVESISGSFSNVVGLPLERLKEELKSWFKRPPNFNL